MQDLKDIKDSFLKEAQEVASEQDLLNLKARYIGKKGLVTERLKNLGSLPPEERPEAGKKLNELKRFIESELQALKERVLEEERRRALERERVDVTVPGVFVPCGKAHPVHQVMDEIIDIF
ncbi:MAG: phenylalanine--tRNA ligase subunit alpha, partial [Nitrospirae bacterium]